MENFDQLSAEELMEVKGGTSLLMDDTIIVNCTTENSGYIVSREKGDLSKGSAE